MTRPAPRLPVLDWDTFSGATLSAIPCVLAQPKTHFTVSGRAAILLALEMLKIGPGDQVLVPTYHCPTMIAPIVALGAQPVFYPINSDGAPDLGWLDQNLTPKICAILVAHYFGLPQPLANVRHWCDLHGVRLVEDCAHALFGISGERAVGRWGDLAIASLTKFLPVPEGGCLVDNLVSSPLLLHTPRARKSQLKAFFDVIHTSVNHGRLLGFGTLIAGAVRLVSILKPKAEIQESSEDGPVEGSTIDIAQSHQVLTTASRWIAQHAPRGRIVSRRRENYEFFARELSEVPGLHPLHAKLPANCAPYVFPLWVGQPDPGYAELRRLMFPVSRWDRLWPNVATIDGDMGLTWSHHVLQLACHQDMTPPELRQMVDTLKRVYTHVPSGQLTHPA